MRIKSLLLGTTATMLAVSGAQAADAIVVEPEPVEYVRVCDAYGSGFFYIPGTETCINFNGFVRSSYSKLYIDGEISGVLAGSGARTVSGASGTPTVNDNSTTVTDPDYTLWSTRGRLNIDVRNETDWGTLRSQLRIEGGSGNGNNNARIDRALISIAGFRFGFSDNYWNTNHGYGWINAEDVNGTASGIAEPGGFYGFDDAILADYTWAADGLSITVGAEDPRISYGRDGFGNATNNGGTDGRVNFYAGMNYAGDGWGIAGTVVHDSIAPEINSAGSTTDIGGWAWKVSANIDLSSMVPGGTLWGQYMADGDYNTDYVHALNIIENPDSVWAVAFGMDLTEEVQMWANYWHVDGGNACAGGPAGGGSHGPQSLGSECDGTTIEEGDVNQWGVGLNWYPAAAPGFHVKGAYFAGSVTGSASYLVNGDAQTGGTSFDYHGFELTVRRDF